MDQQLRREILRMVAEARRLLEEDIFRQLEGEYGISRRGRIDPPERVVTLRANPVRARERQEIEAAIRHLLPTPGGSKGAAEPDRTEWAEAIERFGREVAFTYLNRLAALKMMETRKLIPESVSRGSDSTGFKLFQQVSPEFTRACPDNGYRRYLELLFDEAATGIRVLFDRGLPHSVLFPSPSTLQQVLELLNQESLAPVWSEEETLGWIYQYFTPKELREQVRKESRAPRNRYELAIRNQFYTPAYVVRFLTDNTLGRLWYEMKPDTRLKELCTYLVIRPGESIPQREKKDPREIRVLDPACGSGHFLLYAFDLLAAIYEEEGFDREEIPGLILAHNLYGVDIDLRATQIAALALYLKAQRYFPGARITRINVVCAEPMPGHQELFAEFLATLHSPTLERIARVMWRELELAGEVGSLLKAERTLRDVIAEERRRWADRPKVQTNIFGTHVEVQQQLDFSDVTDEAFWAHAEQELLAHLSRYAAQAVNGGAASRRLFAHDGEQGIRFLEVLRQRYDVVLMNPPFGDAPRAAKAYLEKYYPLTKHDLYTAFVERGLELLCPGGRLGAITSRTGFFLGSSQRWREEILLKKARLYLMADLGSGVLDTATVETAAYCLEAMA